MERERRLRKQLVELGRQRRSLERKANAVQEELELYYRERRHNKLVAEATDLQGSGFTLENALEPLCQLFLEHYFRDEMDLEDLEKEVRLEKNADGGYMVFYPLAKDPDAVAWRIDASGRVFYKTGAVPKFNVYTDPVDRWPVCELDFR